MEIASITAALAGIKSATEIAKIIKDSGASLEAAEIKLKLAELVVALADAKMEIANINEELLNKNKEIQKLKELIDQKVEVVYEEPYYFSIVDDGSRDGPFCQTCYDSDQKLIRLQSPNRNGYWTCNKCESSVVDDTWHSIPE